MSESELKAKKTAESHPVTHKMHESHSGRGLSRNYMFAIVVIVHIVLLSLIIAVMTVVFPTASKVTALYDALPTAPLVTAAPAAASRY
jgi:uncharacterized BrkB/YihY/UPF0761 family membrane protein